MPCVGVRRFETTGSIEAYLADAAHTKLSQLESLVIRDGGFATMWHPSFDALTALRCFASDGAGGCPGRPLPRLRDAHLWVHERLGLFALSTSAPNIEKLRLSGGRSSPRPLTESQLTEVGQLLHMREFRSDAPLSLESDFWLRPTCCWLRLRRLVLDDCEGLTPEMVSLLGGRFKELRHLELNYLRGPDMHVGVLARLSASSTLWKLAFSIVDESAPSTSSHLMTQPIPTFAALLNLRPLRHLTVMHGSPAAVEAFRDGRPDVLVECLGRP